MTEWPARAPMIHRRSLLACMCIALAVLGVAYGHEEERPRTGRAEEVAPLWETVWVAPERGNCTDTVTGRCGSSPSCACTTLKAGIRSADSSTRFIRALSGEYFSRDNTNLNFMDNSALRNVPIALQSVEGPEATVITCTKPGHAPNEVFGPVFRFDSGETSEWSISGFTIKNCRRDPAQEEERGSVMIFQDSSPALTSMVFEGNKGPGALWVSGNSRLNVINSDFTGANGTAILVDSRNASVVLTGVEFSGNTVVSGYSAVNASNALSLTIRSSLFVNNTASDGSLLGIASDIDGSDLVSQVTISDTEFRANIGNPAALYLRQARCNIEDSRFIENLPVLSNPSSYGTILNDGGALTVTDCEFEGNQASDIGGSICQFRQQATTRASMSVIRSVFRGCRAVLHDGGAVQVSDGISTFFNCTFEDNSAELYGGAVAARPRLNVEELPYLELIQCTFTRNNATLGGAMAVVGSFGVYAHGSSFEANAAEAGGAAVFDDGVDQFRRSSAEGTVPARRSSCEQLGSMVAVQVGLSPPDLHSLLHVHDEYHDEVAIKRTRAASPKLNGAASDSLMIFSNSTFSHNSASQGGAFFMQLDGLEVVGSKFISNSASLVGGAVYCDRGEQTFTSSAFEENSAFFFGGAVATVEAGATVFEDCEFVQNTATFFYAGAVLCGLESTASYVGCSFLENEAPSGGAVTVAKGGACEFYQTSFHRSSALTRGGAVLVEDSNPYFQGCTFSNSSAIDGGGLYIDGSGNPRLVNCTFIENGATSSGGAVRVGQDGLGHLEGCTFDSNVALTGGGGLACGNNAKTTVINCTFDGNFALSTGGGAQITDHATPELHHCTFRRNNAISSGGGVAVSSLATPVLNGCTFAWNEAGSRGGGASVNDQAGPEFNDCHFIHNTSPNEAGGILLTDHSTASLVRCHFVRNEAGSSGGAASAYISTSPRFVNSTLNMNKAGTRGGALALFDYSTATFERCEINSNSATSGAGISLMDHANPLFNGSHIHSNVAATGGAGVLTSDFSNGTFYDCHFHNNSVNSGPGGACSVVDFSEPRFVLSTFTRNNATLGGAVYAGGDSSLALDGCEVQGNHASGSGGGAYFGGTSLAMVEGTTWMENDAVTSGGAVMFAETAEGFVKQGRIRSNTAGQQGGGVAIENQAQAALVNVSMNSNFAASGGAVFVDILANSWIDGGAMTNNTGLVAGGAIHMKSLKSKVSNLVVGHNTAPSGGALIMNAYFHTESLSSFENCSFVSNLALRGGALYVLPEIGFIPSKRDVAGTFSRNGTASECMQSAPQEPTFHSCRFEGNTADFGGGVYVSGSAERTITFGGNTTFQGNAAAEFGGAVFLSTAGDRTGDPDQSWVFGASFQANRALFGGSVVGTNYPLPLDIDVFCCECSFAANNTSPVQNADGFASYPSKLDSEDCPSEVRLDNETMSVTAVLEDGFGNVYRGPYIATQHFTVTLEVGADCEIVSDANTTIPLGEDGTAVFSEFYLLGRDRSSCNLVFTLSPKLDLPESSCNVALDGCPSGEEIHRLATFDTCTEVASPGGLSTTDQLIIVICVLLLIIALMVGTLLGVYAYKKYYKRRRIAYDDIPDWDTDGMTLGDILNDPQIPRIPWPEIELGPKIGQGAAGIVFRGTRTAPMTDGEERTEIALKQLTFGTDVLSDDFAEEFLSEIKLMSNLKHENVVGFIGVAIPDPTVLYLVVELMHRGSVRDVLDRKGRNIPWDLRVQLAVDAASGMNYLHSRKVIHRDLKPQNFLVNNSWTCKIADFGISTIKPEHTQTLTVIGTPVYMAPEVLAHSKYSEKADVYSFGVCLIELFSGQRPYSEPEYRKTNQAQLMFRVVKEQLRPKTDGLPASLVQLANDCWNPEPTLRPGFEEVISRLMRMYGIAFDYEQYAPPGSSVRTNASLTGASAISFRDDSLVEETGSESGSPLGWEPSFESTPQMPHYMHSAQIMGTGYSVDEPMEPPSFDDDGDISMRQFGGGETETE